MVNNVSISESQKSNFIRQIIKKDIESNKNNGQVITRFPPEPNGYLHIGHAKSICLNFGVAKEFNGETYLRFDDTNPQKEEQKYADSMQEDISWLGFKWKEIRHASDYFEQLYQYAIYLIQQGKAYVDSLSADEIRAYRGALTAPGKNSPYRDRSVAENIELFEQMKQGEFANGQHVLRAKINMNSPNINLRDPVLYRILHVEHHRTGNKWCIYPMYDYAHCISDAIEHITHSLCTLEFEDHRPLYDWILDQLPIDNHPQQIEFARLEPKYTITSKRKLKELVDQKYVSGWDDPRMPTISGLRRRGYTPESIKDFCEMVGVSKAPNVVEMSMLEHAIRDDLGDKAPRVMGVMNPLKVVIENFPDDKVEWLDCPYHQQQPEMGNRKVPFAKEIYIERADFMEEPPKKYFRLKPGGAVRLRYAYIIDLKAIIKDEAGNVIELRCTYDPDTKSGAGQSDRKVKGTIHWVSISQGMPAEVRLYDRLFTVPLPSSEKEDFKDVLNTNALEVVNAVVEPSLKTTSPGKHFQFERLGYFVTDLCDHQQGKRLVFNRTVTLRDTWAKVEKQENQ